MEGYTIESLQADLSNPSAINTQQLPARAFYYPKTRLCLNGNWKFHYSENPLASPLPSDEFKFTSELAVPGHWQLQGHGAPVYLNVNFPFNVNVPNPPSDNPTGSYCTTFTIPDNWNCDHYRIRLDGVDNAYHLFVNGALVGFHTGSRNSAEFDLANYLKPGVNTVWVRVYQWSFSTYIEDQDQWRMSGIFRDVHILGFNTKALVEDFRVVTDLDKRYKNADLSVSVQVADTQTEVDVSLIDASKSIVTTAKLNEENSFKVTLNIDNPKKWTAETPYLYQIQLDVRYDKEVVETIKEDVGFRKVELKDGQVKVNGRAILIRGVNRHDHHPKYGRAEPLECIERDLCLMKQHNINAIRTSHYPNCFEFYRLANKLGFWVFDEADLECHGFFECVRRPVDGSDDVEYRGGKKELFEQAKLFVSDNKDWEQAYIDRAYQLVKRDVNQPCVIVWSLGNEAFYGRNHVAMAKKIRELDSTRLIHYEPDFKAESADIYSRMYPSPSSMLEFLVGERTKDKPLILCEYGHAMGNGPGSLREYQDLFYKHKEFQGGFIWEWNNHGLEKIVDGEIVYGYGGDFGERFHDGVFCLDGLTNSTHNPNPGLIEYKKVIEPIRVDFGESEFSLTNLFNFETLSKFNLKAIVKHLYGGKETTLSSEIIEIPDTQPSSSTSFPYVKFPDVQGGTVIFEAEIVTKEDTEAVKSGHVIAWAQKLLRNDNSAPLVPRKSTILNVLNNRTEIIVTDSRFEFIFDKVKGKVKSWIVGGESIIIPGLNVLSFWRAPLNNDEKNDKAYWQKFGLDFVSQTVKNVECESITDGVTITVKSLIGPPALAWSFEATQVYKVSPTGFKLETELLLTGFDDSTKPKEAPRIGYEFGVGDFQLVKWHGRGTGESYPDKKESQKFGIFEGKFGELGTRYEFPQENGNHEDTEWVILEGEHKILVTSCKGFAFKASDEVGLDEAKHPNEVKKGDKYIRLDYKSHGVGSEICGPPVLEPYRLKLEQTTKFDFEFRIIDV